MNVPEEEGWAGRCIEAALPGVKVTINDDNSADSMFDLLLGREGLSIGAAEVTAAASQDQIELWQVANGRDDQRVMSKLGWGWFVTLKPDCRFKRMLPDLEMLLAECEMLGMEGVGSGLAATEFDSALDALGIHRAQKIGTSTPGSVSFTIDLEDNTGWISSAESSVAGWISEWIRDPGQEHNIRKLVASGLPERHLFVIVPPLSPAPFQVQYFLNQREATLPSRELSLPEGLTHLWLTNSSPVGGSVVRWDPDEGWNSSPKPPEFENRDVSS